MDVSALIMAAMVTASPSLADYQGTYEDIVDGPVARILLTNPLPAPMPTALRHERQL